MNGYEFALSLILVGGIGVLAMIPVCLVSAAYSFGLTIESMEYDMSKKGASVSRRVAPVILLSALLFLVGVAIGAVAL